MPEISRFFGIIITMYWDELHKDELIYNWKESQKDNPNFITLAPLR